MRIARWVYGAGCAATPTYLKDNMGSPQSFFVLKALAPSPRPFFDMLPFLRTLICACFCVASWGSSALAQTGVPPITIAMIEGLSGPFANTGEAAFRNLVWAVERVNQSGGVRLPAAEGGARPLALKRFDSKGNNEAALTALRAAINSGARIVMQGNSSATAAALIDAINKHNDRQPTQKVLFLNYAAVDPILTNEKCSFWHFRFDADADMRMRALMSVLQEDQDVKKVYIIGQDYSFGQAVAREAKRQLAAVRPDIRVVGDELHPIGRIKDFLPYASKILTSGAQAVITGNWGNDLTLLVKAAKEAGYKGKFYTYYGNALGAPAAIGDAGLGKVLAVAEWMPNMGDEQSSLAYQAFRTRFPDPSQDYLHMRMQLMVRALAQAIEAAASTDADAVARRLESSHVSLFGRQGYMRAADHQFQQDLVVGLMARRGDPGVLFDVEGSGYGFQVIRRLKAVDVMQASACKMRRPAG